MMTAELIESPYFILYEYKMNKYSDWLYSVEEWQPSLKKMNILPTDSLLTTL